MSDTTQGVRLATIQALARYWTDEHDWRKCEATLNSLPQFITEIDGLDSVHSHPRPLEARERLADHHHARLAGIGDRAA